MAGLDRDALEEPSIIKDDADGTFPLVVFLAVTTCKMNKPEVLLIYVLSLVGGTDGPCRAMPSGVGKKEKPLRGLVTLPFSSCEPESGRTRTMAFAPIL